MGQDLSFTRDVLRGIQCFTQGKPDWIFRDSPLSRQILKPLRQWQPDGIIAHLADAKLADEVLKLGVPLVNTTSTLENFEAPLVEVDHLAIGRMAAEYFLSLGFKNFGFFGSSWTGFSKGREAGFSEVITARGFQLRSCYGEYLPRPPADESWVRIDEEVKHWLGTLPKPVAILASNDVPARELADICRQLDLHVPDEVALLGVDNDSLECNLATPALSSIAIPGQQIGYEAARILELLMSGKVVERARVVLPPIRIVERPSTDTLAIEDGDVAMALAFIRNHAHEPIDVDTVLDKVAVSRRVLERKFRSHLDRTVLAEIRRARVEMAKALLTESDLAMPLVAKRSGFSGARRLAVVFKEVVGEAPTEFRSRSRTHDNVSLKET